MNSKVGIVVLNYNNGTDTVGCLMSLQDLRYDNKVIIVVDNASSDNSVKEISAFYESSKLKYMQFQLENVELDEDQIGSCANVLIISPLNGGYSKGNNIGIRYALLANCKFILVLNSDTLVTPHFLSELVRSLSCMENAVAVGPIIVGSENNERSYGRRFHRGWDYWFIPPSIFWHFSRGKRRWKYLNYQSESDTWDEVDPLQIDILSGCCMLFKSEYFKEYGLLDENTFLYAEELILAAKVHRCNKLFYCVPGAVVFHKGGASTSKGGSLFMVKEFIRSNNYYLKAYRNFNALQRHFWLLGMYGFLAAIRFKTLLHKR